MIFSAKFETILIGAYYPAAHSIRFRTCTKFDAKMNLKFYTKIWNFCFSLFEETLFFRLQWTVENGQHVEQNLSFVVW